MITSCSPGWIKFCEHYFPEMTENLSTCKSPQQMFGALYKTYYAEEDTFIGGITYSIEIRNIPAGGSSEALTPSHFSSAMSRFVGSGVYDS